LELTFIEKIRAYSALELSTSQRLEAFKDLSIANVLEIINNKVESASVKGVLLRYLVDLDSEEANGVLANLRLTCNSTNQEFLEQVYFALMGGKAHHIKEAMKCFNKPDEGVVNPTNAGSFSGPMLERIKTETLLLNGQVIVDTLIEVILDESYHADAKSFALQYLNSKPSTENFLKLLQATSKVQRDDQGEVLLALIEYNNTNTFKEHGDKVVRYLPKILGNSSVKVRDVGGLVLKGLNIDHTDVFKSILET